MQNFNVTLSQVHDFKQNVLKHAGESYMQIVRDWIAFKPFENHGFYIFSFIKKEHNERIHQPRLTKTAPVPGATLIWVDPKKPEEMEICWTLPPLEEFHLAGYGKAFGDEFVYECVQTYLKNPDKLMENEKPITKEKFVELYRNYTARVRAMKAQEADIKKNELAPYQKI